MEANKNQNSIIIVSGLPRSGTSMMMKILQAGGMDLLTDSIRKPDDHNPRGYYEYEPVKSLQKGQKDWLPLAIGKAVKIIAPLLPFLADNYHYKIVFMTRSLDEILDSQRKMLSALEKNDDVSDDKMMKTIFENQLKKVISWMDSQPAIEYTIINYNDLIISPSDHLTKLVDFLGENLNISAMIKVIEPQLYRSKFGIR